MIKNELDNAYKLATKGKTEDAFNICEQLLREHVDEKVLILRQRAHIYAYLNNLTEALSDRLEIISIGTTSPQDYFFSGVYSLELSKCNEAISLFGESLRLGMSVNGKSYKEESFLLRAYSYLCVGEFDNALEDCNHIGDDVEYFIESDGPISKKRLVTYIESKKG